MRKTQSNSNPKQFMFNYRASGVHHGVLKEVYPTVVHQLVTTECQLVVLAPNQPPSCALVPLYPGKPTCGGWRVPKCSKSMPWLSKKCSKLRVFIHLHRPGGIPHTPRKQFPELSHRNLGLSDTLRNTNIPRDTMFKQGAAA